MIVNYEAEERLTAMRADLTRAAQLEAEGEYERAGWWGMVAANALAAAICLERKIVQL